MLFVGDALMESEAVGDAVPVGLAGAVAVAAAGEALLVGDAVPVGLADANEAFCDAV